MGHFTTRIHSQCGFPRRCKCACRRRSCSSSLSSPSALDTAIGDVVDCPSSGSSNVHTHQWLSASSSAALVALTGPATQAAAHAPPRVFTDLALQAATAVAIHVLLVFFACGIAFMLVHQHLLSSNGADGDAANAALDAFYRAAVEVSAAAATGTTSSSNGEYDGGGGGGWGWSSEAPLLNYPGNSPESLIVVFDSENSVWRSAALSA